MSYYHKLSAGLTLNEKGKKNIEKIQKIIDGEEFRYAIQEAKINRNYNILELSNDLYDYNEHEVYQALEKIKDFIKIGETIECIGEDNEQWRFVLRKKSGKSYWEEESGRIVYGLDDPLDKFCKKEAKFRLAEVHEVPEEEISEELIEKTATAIRNMLTNWEPLFDFMDAKIAEVLKKYRDHKDSD